MKYSMQNFEPEHMARAIGKALPISTKASVEICMNIRGKSLARAKAMLKDVINMKKPLKYSRYTHGAGHKPGMSSGKFPINASTEILRLLESVEANAQFRGLNTSELKIAHINAHDAGNVWRYGRKRRRKLKLSHVEVVVKEGKKAETKAEVKQ